LGSAVVRKLNAPTACVVANAAATARPNAYCLEISNADLIRFVFCAAFGTALFKYRFNRSSDTILKKKSPAEAARSGQKILVCILCPADNRVNKMVCCAVEFAELALKNSEKTWFSGSEYVGLHAAAAFGWKTHIPW
jgi:hypothetical protein